MSEIDVQYPMSQEAIIWVRPHCQMFLCGHFSGTALNLRSPGGRIPLTVERIVMRTKRFPVSTRSQRPLLDEVRASTGAPPVVVGGALTCINRSVGHSLALQYIDQQKCEKFFELGQFRAPTCPSFPANSWW